VATSGEADGFHGRSARMNKSVNQR